MTETLPGFPLVSILVARGRARVTCVQRSRELGENRGEKGRGGRQIWQDSVPRKVAQGLGGPSARPVCLVSTPESRPPPRHGAAGLSAIFLRPLSAQGLHLLLV